MNTKLIQKLMKEESKHVVSGLKNLVSIERKNTGEILHYFYVIQKRRIFADYGYSNIYKFGIKELGYTEAETQIRVTSSRLLGEIPELELKLNEGKLSLSTVSMANTLFNREKKAENAFTLDKKIEVLKNFENKSVKECEKEIFKVATVIPVPPEKVRQVSNETAQMTINVPLEFLDEIETLKNIYSKSHPGITTAELLALLVKKETQKLDPAREPRKYKQTKVQDNVQGGGQTDFQAKVQRGVSGTYEKFGAPTAFQKRQVWQKYQSQCSFQTFDGKRCDSKYGLEIDHIQPKALGGDTSLENLRLLCKAHNQKAAIDIFGFTHMNRFINGHEVST
ncbi:MAG: HNH endonuclease signature motif containing protein [Oligoflexia bacterium]|nr:HNH endonuclease signature motif containing protein [Oligoflexia bacterium]